MANKKVLSVAVVTFLLLCGVVATDAQGYGWYWWWGGGTSAAAVGWNGSGGTSWNWGPSSGNWGWWWCPGGCYASAYTNTYPYASYQQNWGWNYASAQAHSQWPLWWPNRTADAWAYAWNWPGWWGWWAPGGFWWRPGGFSYARAQTWGAPSYATAYSRSCSYWWWRWWIPRVWWNNWVDQNGPRIPFYWAWWWWGWIDGDMGDMAAEIDLAVMDEVGGTTNPLMYAHVRDNGDGTFDMTGDLDPCDLIYNPDVGGTGHPGFDIVGHNANAEFEGQEPEEPYMFPFMVAAEEIDSTAEEVLIRCAFTIDGRVGQVPDEDICCNRPMADMNGDCCVDIMDFVMFAHSWLECGYWGSPDECMVYAP